MASGLAVLVFGLGLMSVSPVLHQWVHHEHHSDHSHDQKNAPPAETNHRCAIVAFATGITFAIDTAILADRPNIGEHHLVVEAPCLLLASPRFLLPLGRGPPVSLS